MININKYINFMIIGLAFCLPISKAGIVFFELLLIILWIIEFNFKYKINEILKSKFLIILAVFILFSSASLLWSSNTEFALLYLKKYWHFLVIPIIYVSLKYKYVNYIFSAFLIGVLLSEIMFFLIFFELITYKDVPSSNPSAFMNHSNYSLFLSMTSMILLNKIVFSEELKYKIMYLLYFIVTVCTLFLNGGRTGQIIFIILIITMFLMSLKNKFKGLLLSLIIVTSILSLAYNYSPTFNKRATQGINDIKTTLLEKNYNDSFGQRVSLWIIGANVGMDNLPFGTGIGDEKNGMQHYVLKYNLERYIGMSDSGYIDYHSMYIQYFVQLGIVGLLVVIYLIYSLSVLKFSSRYYQNINISFVICIFIFSTVSSMLHIMVAMTFFAFFASMMISISKIENTNSPS